jgi:hypothetical protein
MSAKKSKKFPAFTFFNAFGFRFQYGLATGAQLRNHHKA